MHNPLAALLYTWSLRAADVYGLLCADPGEYLIAVAPTMRVELDVVAAAIAAQATYNLVLIYEVGGQRVLYIRDHRHHVPVRWRRVGRPTYPLPPHWHIPDAVRRAVEEGVPPERFGLTGDGDRLLVPDVGQRVCRVDQQPAGPSVDAQIQHARRGLSPDDLALLDQMLALFAAENPSGRMTQKRQLALTLELTQLYGQLGESAWRYGMREALRRGVANLRYVKKCAQNWVPAPNGPRNGGTRMGTLDDVMGG